MRNSQYLPILKAGAHIFTLGILLYLTWYFIYLFNNIPIDADKWETILRELPVCIILLFPVCFNVYLSFPQNLAQSFIDICNSAGISIPALLVFFVFIFVLIFYMIAQIEDSKKESIEKVLFTLGGLITGSFLQRRIDTSTTKLPNKNSSIADKANLQDSGKPESVL